MSLILKCRIKDKGDITWPAVPDQEGWPDRDTPEYEKRLESIRDEIRRACENTRTVLGTTPGKTVHVSVTFRPDIMVDA